MKKELLLIGFIVWNLNFIYGQICGTPHPSNLTIYPKEKANFQKRGASSALCINIFYHIVRNTNGTNAFPIPNTDDITAKLNEFYSPHNITINNLGTNFINNSNFVQISKGEHTTLMNSGFDVPNAINYYIVEELWDVYRNGTYQGFVAGVADGIPSNSLVIRRDRVLLSTSHHELGHCLNLYHTFQGTAPNTSGCAEAIDGSNCNTCGDVVCDTPADSNAGNSGGYLPDLTNIMSYYNNRNHFTNGQGNRMRYAIQNESILQNITSNSCSTISIVDFLCPSQNKTVTLTNIGNSTTNWSTSSNLQTLSSNNFSITLKAINNNIQENAWVKANLSNGVIFKEEFWIGKPKVHTGNNPYTICANNFFQNEFYTLPISPGAKNYKLISNSPYLFVSELTNSPGQIYMSASRVGNYSITLTTSNECGSSQATIYIKARRCGQGGFEFRAYPNPVTSNLTIENTLKNNSRKTIQSNKVNKNNYELYDFNTNLVLKGKLEELTKINVSNLKRGTYFLKIHTTNNIETHQIIIK